jgi:hypothetical protein
MERQPCQVAFRLKKYRSTEELQIYLDDGMHYYNQPHSSGKDVLRSTPVQTLIDGKEVWNDKIAALNS